jgi:imidazolonepropionase-like amidohydrolase
MIRRVQGTGFRVQRRARRIGVFAFVLVLGAAPAAAAQTIAITGGRVHPVSGPVIENGTVIIRGTTIAAIGGPDTPVPPDALRVNAAGKWVTPGFFNSGTVLGISEIGAVQESVDIPATGRGDAITASHQVWDSFNPNSPLIQATRNDGITSAVVTPGGGLVAGQGALFDLSDGSMSQMLRRPGVAMVADLGSKGGPAGGTRAEVLQRLRELILDTRTYVSRRAEYERNATRELAARRSDLEAMIPVVRGQMPLLLSANRASEIQAAIDLSRELNVRVIINGGAEAWMVAPNLAQARIPVILDALNNIPGSFATLGARQENAGLLRRAGVPVIITGSSDPFFARNVRFEAGNAVAFGMTWDDALRAVTVEPALVFGVGDRVGTLQAGRDANVVIWSGDPFEPLTLAESVYVRGQQVHRPSRQDELMRRYRTVPPAYRPPPPR